MKDARKALKEIWTKNFRMLVNLSQREGSVDESAWEFQLEGIEGAEVVWPPVCLKLGDFQIPT